MICTACRGLKIENTSDPGVFRPCHWCGGSGLEPGWNPSPAFLAASAHIGWGAYLTLFLCFIAGPWMAAGILVPLAAVKEFVIDPLWEKASMAGGLLDFSFYSFGIAGGMVSFWFCTAGGL